MTLPLVPLSGRVLIRPLANPAETESGLVLVEDRKPETMGQVLAIGGDGDPRVASLRSCLLACRRAVCDYEPRMADQIDTLLEATAETPEPDCRVGDVVLFSWQTGQEIQLGDERYLIMPEADLLAVVEQE